MGPESALVIIDVQKDFSGPDGKAPVCREQADSIIGVINNLIDRFAAGNQEIIYIVNEWSNPVIRFFTKNTGAKGTPGAELDSRLKVVPGSKFSKSVPNSFSNKDFALHLKAKGIRRLYITGLAAEYCVSATIRNALKKGYTVTAVSDAIAAKTCKKLESKLASFKMNGAEVLPSTVIAADWTPEEKLR